MELKFFNTLTRKKEEFTPLTPKCVTMYSCGPTVYNYAHIGNLRTYVFMDLIRRTLKYHGYKIKGVLNITDVGHLVSDGDEGEDKMSLAASRTGKTPLEIAAFYSKVFFDDIAALNIGKPEIIAKATDHIQDMLDYVIKLVELGYGYETSDGIYFDISKFPEYGKLSGIRLEDQQAGARVEVNSEKRNAADFALWKKAPKEHIMQWPSPWGMGYPGWHIECSAMSKKYLGTVMDIHSGGVDHIPIHHENEIAQSESLCGCKTVRYWMHGEFMLVNGGKMSKSLGNTYTIAELRERGFDPLDFRYFCLNTHYRKKLNFTFESLEGAKVSRSRLNELLASHKVARAHVAAEKLAEYKAQFDAAIADDINVPLALGVLWTMIKDEVKSADVYQVALEFDRVLGLDLDKVSLSQPQQDVIDVPSEVKQLAQQRLEAKRNKDYATADQLRAQVSALGYEIIDTKEGYTFRQK